MKLPRRAFLHLAAGAAALPTASRFAWAQAYPTRPVRITTAKTAFISAKSFSSLSSSHQIIMTVLRHGGRGASSIAGRRPLKGWSNRSRSGGSRRARIRATQRRRC